MMINKNDGIPNSLSLSTFYLGEGLFGIDMANLQEINRQSGITRVPQAPEDIEGILNLRGRIVTVIDLGKRLGLSPVHKSGSNRNIIVNFDEEYVGLLVDAMGEVVTALKQDIESAPANIREAKGKYFQGVLKTGKQLIAILDIDAILKE